MNSRSIGRMVAVVAAALLAAPAQADCDDLEQVVGFTLVASTRVQGEFQGCDYDRLVAFDNGLTLRCSEHRPKQAQHPKALVFLRQFDVGGGTVSMVKACIDGEIYATRKP
jgi:hypothetical protein